jgi:hypothetical protein
MTGKIFGKPLLKRDQYDGMRLRNDFDVDLCGISKEYKEKSSLN